MKKQSNLISQNLTALRQYHKYSQEEVAEKVGVTRQAVAYSAACMAGQLRIG